MCTAKPNNTPTPNDSPPAAPSRRSSPSPSSSGPGGAIASQACAACKYQRRRCAPDCVLSPYFPAQQQKSFLNAHRLFGVSNITKVIKTVKPSEREIAAKSIIAHSNIRAADPVGGCYRIICELQRRIQTCGAELDRVLHQLALYKHQQAGLTNQARVHGGSLEPQQGIYLNEDCYSDLGFAADIKPITSQHIHTIAEPSVARRCQAVEEKTVEDSKECSLSYCKSLVQPWR